MSRASCFFCGNPARNHFCEGCVTAISESPSAMGAVNDAIKPVEVIMTGPNTCECGNRKSSRREHCHPCGMKQALHPCAGLKDKPCKNYCLKRRVHCWICTKALKRKTPPPGKWVIPATATGAAADCARRLLMEINNRQRV